MYGQKIRMIRELRGFSQEHVATMLGLTQASYSRIETNQTKLSTEMLERLAKEFGVTPADIMSTEPTVINFYGTNHGAQCTFGTVGYFDGTHKEIYEKLLASKDEEIARMQRTIDTLLART